MLKNYNQPEYDYSETTCIQVCLQIYVYEQCGCVNPYLWHMRSIVLPDTDKIIFAPVCDYSDSRYKRASYRLFSSATLFQNYRSNCLQECLINSFVLQTSSLMLQIDWALDSIKNCTENSDISLPDNWSIT
ncbi:unnamed protein product [Rotaria sp. Silwood2]|nr:unnamed protein product [Rotaria sp. Silwood2]CAF2927942.1 unnamed protein product [Rotaria sp. Silwood2]CAF3313264.1 unnamed protein product [Rotaria sp. Silwood2]CAF3950286.1 unnamed protein product [Rotaria sp. Silwood2]CAF3955279.1 unnamed protein product [Rotaria sp. Silwood2]